jgi:DNA-binding GntR family transcriptional regulator
MDNEKDSETSRSARPNHTIMAYNGIRKMLFHHELVPGQKLGYRELAERLNMSMTPVIQALKFLEFQGLVRHEPNRGYYIEPINIKEIEEIYNLRIIIEVALLSESSKVINEIDIKILRATLKDYESARQTENFNQLLIEHRNFHLNLARISQCRIQVQILNTLFDLLYFKYGGNIIFSSFEGSVNTEHHSILDAVASKNLSVAKKLLSEHLLNTKKRILSDFGKMIIEREAAHF